MADSQLTHSLIGWRILSSVEGIIPGKYAKTRAKNWASSYSPEFLMLEMMAQTGGLIVGAVRHFQGNIVFAKVEKADFNEFRQFPNEEHELVIEAFARDGVSEQGSWIDAEIQVNSKKTASARFFLIDAGDLNGTGKSLTFHPEFLNYYHVREKIIHE